MLIEVEIKYKFVAKMLTPDCGITILSFKLDWLCNNLEISFGPTISAELLIDWICSAKQSCNAFFLSSKCQLK